MVETFAKSPFGQTAEKGAIALEYACTSPDMDGAAAPVLMQRCLAHAEPGEHVQHAGQGKARKKPQLWVSTACATGVQASLGGTWAHPSWAS